MHLSSALWPVLAVLKAPEAACARRILAVHRQCCSRACNFSRAAATAAACCRAIPEGLQSAAGRSGSGERPTGDGPPPGSADSRHAIALHAGAAQLPAGKRCWVM